MINDNGDLVLEIPAHGDILIHTVPAAELEAAGLVSASEFERLREALEKIERFGHSPAGCGHGYTCANMAADALNGGKDDKN